MKKIVVCLVLITTLLSIGGCSTSNEQRKSEEVLSSTKPKNKDNQNESTKIQNVDLIDILSREVDEAISILGKPINNSDYLDESYLEYDGLYVYIDPDTQKITSMDVNDSKYTIKGIKLGLKPSEIRKILGMANEEGIVEYGQGEVFEMNYIISDGTKEYLISLISDSFTSPVEYAYISEIFYEEPLYTVEELQEMIRAIWIVEDLIHEKNAYEYATAFNGKSIIINSPWSKRSLDYRIVAPNIMEIETYNSVSKEKGWGDRRYFEFSQDGDKLYIYKINDEDEILEDTLEVYYKYSEIPD